MSTIGNNSSNKNKENIGRICGCYGCGVCVAACPQKVIKMELVGGFYSPVVEQEGCVECGICLNVCAFNHKEICAIEEGKENTPIENFAAYVNNPQLRKRVTSGGIVYTIAKEGVAQGAKFCGVRYDIPRQRAEHYIASTAEDLLPSIGSKYIQSYSAEAFSALTLAAEQKYIVVGTPCQIDSLRRLMRSRKCEQNFLFIDFFCHGVPSLLMWQKYLASVRQKVGDEKVVKFRSKANGWHESTTTEVEGERGTIISPMSKGDLFFKFFLGDRCLNAACYDSCKYKYTACCADIRVGDLWGKKYRSDDNGVSAVVCFTQKGAEAVKRVADCTIVSESFTDVADFQLKQNAKRAPSYNVVKKLLTTSKTIEQIDKAANRAELPLKTIRTAAYYLRRLLQKAGLKR